MSEKERFQPNLFRQYLLRMSLFTGIVFAILEYLERRSTSPWFLNLPISMIFGLLFGLTFSVVFFLIGLIWGARLLL